MIISRNAFETGTVVETTEPVSNYVAIPVGFTGRVVACGPPHKTVNGGGQDVTIALDLDNEQHAALSVAIRARLVELQIVEAAADRAYPFYTDRLIESASKRVMIRSTHLREV